MARRRSKKPGSAAPTLETATPPRKPSRSSRSTWKLLDRGTTIAGGLLARQVSSLTWRAATGRKPPTAGRHPEVDAREAVAWAVVGGALVEVTRLGIRRWAADYWVRSTGDLPPGMKPLKDAKHPVRSASPRAEAEAAVRAARRGRRR